MFLKKIRIKYIKTDTGGQVENTKAMKECG